MYDKRPVNRFIESARIEREAEEKEGREGGWGGGEREPMICEIMECLAIYGGNTVSRPHCAKHKADHNIPYTNLVWIHSTCLPPSGLRCKTKSDIFLQSVRAKVKNNYSE